MPKRAIFLIPLLLSVPAAAQIPADFFGMNAYFTTNNPPTVSIGSLGKTTCTGWPSIETARGLYNWHNIDYGVNKSNSLGIDYFISGYGIPDWTVTDKSTCVPSGCGGSFCTILPDDLSDVDNFWSKLATRYCGTALQTIELYNEPYSELQHNASWMVTITTHMYNAIRAACPGMKIGTPSMTSDGGSYYEDYAKDYFAGGGPTGVDIATVHEYSDYLGSGTDMPESIVPRGPLFNNELLALIQKYLPNKPVWNTEGSWDLNSSTPWNTPDLKAAFISRWYILHWSSGFSRAYWYGWDEANVGTLAPSLDPPGSSIPVTAYQQTYNWLVGRIMSPLCAASGDGVTWTCGLTGSGGYVALIVWDTAGDENYKPPASTGYTRYRDLAGKVTPYSGGPVVVGVKPILFEH